MASQLPVVVEMGDVVQRMHAGVGATGANHPYGTVQKRPEGGLEFTLYGGHSRLDLPSAEGGPVVGQV